MKATAHQLDVPFSKHELEVITKEVKETLAFEHLKQHKNFSAVDLWNIQRQRKNITPRRNYV